MTATLTAKGQITIPAAVRQQLALKIGDRVSFVVADNKAEMIPLSRDVASLKSILPKPQRRLTLAQMKAAIAKGAAR